MTLLTIIDLDLDDPIESYTVESADQEMLSVCLQRAARVSRCLLSPGSTASDAHR
jgi:hypothetical protein